jgi:SanA protein
MKSTFRLMLGGLSLFGLAFIAPRLYTALKYGSQIYTAAAAPSESVAIVFGAGLRRNGGPTTILYDRVAAAAELYRLGKVQRLLLSGDARFGHDEPGAMQQTAITLGVPEEALTLDGAGWSTYDTCYRAKAIFGVNRVILVTQNFHLPRALFICEALGMQADGVSADLRPYRQRTVFLWELREVFATANAWVEVHITRPNPATDDGGRIIP